MALGRDLELVSRQVNCGVDIACMVDSGIGRRTVHGLVAMVSIVIPMVVTTTMTVIIPVVVMTISIAVPPVPSMPVPTATTRATTTTPLLGGALMCLVTITLTDKAFQIITSRIPVVASSSSTSGIIVAPASASAATPVTSVVLVQGL
jgi:hypothetical protein